MAKWVKATGRKPDALVGQCPNRGDYIIWTTAEVENKVVKNFPVCPDIERAELIGLINIIEVYDVPDEPIEDVRPYEPNDRYRDFDVPDGPKGRRTSKRKI